MATYSSSLNVIRDFLAQKRIAIVGVSRNPKDFSASLFREFVKRGYDVVPVNPKAEEVPGWRAFAHVTDIQPAVDAVLLMTSPEVTETVVPECVKAGIRRIWMYRAGGSGAVSPKAVEFCQQNGIQLIPGECPFMFFPHNGFHSVHGFVRKITGSFPKAA
ncbi:MAG TPA: CoA-binding protein [Candidatus Sulfotelmatobacter sp.]|nr:CoA-binding protein [Candidatus Sulfotelmatobacter sp.]